MTSTTTTITIGLPSGSYTYTASTVNKSYAPTYTPSFTVSGAPLAVSVPFSPFTYTATFTESGLGGGDTWYVNISGGLSLSGTSTSLSTQLTNGSYTYTAATSDKRYAPTYTPSFTVNGAPVMESISFASVTYAVTFTESGLPAGDTWYVNITGGPSLSATGATTSLMTSLPNGTYSFSVATNDKTYAASYTPSVTVNGGPASASIVFAPFTYAVTFKETGLPGGTMWSVTVDSVTHSSSTATITGFQEINGTYSYTATVAGNGSTIGLLRRERGTGHGPRGVLQDHVHGERSALGDHLAGDHELGDAELHGNEDPVLRGERDLLLHDRDDLGLPHGRPRNVHRERDLPDHPLDVRADHLYGEVRRDGAHVGLAHDLVRHLQQHDDVHHGGLHLVPRGSGTGARTPTRSGMWRTTAWTGRTRGRGRSRAAADRVKSYCRPCRSTLSW